MACDMTSASTKNLLMEYFKLQGKEDMADAIDQNCDENRGIVFNRHPATDESKFSSIYDYSTASVEKISLSALADAITASHSSIDSTTSDSLVNLSMESLSERFSKTISNSFNNMSQRNNGSECEYTGKEEFLKNRSRQFSKKNVSQEEVLSTKSITEQIENVPERAVSVDSTDNTCDVIVPEGKGKFQNFAGEDYVYVLLKNGTRHYYPMNLVKYNRAYLKNNPLFTLNYNYKDKALKHTQNILKANKSNMWKADKKEKKETTVAYEFIDFPEEAKHLKEHLTVNDATKINHNENYLIHLKTKQQSEKCNGLGEKFVDDPTCNPIKKNIHVRDVTNSYQLQKISSYKMINEEVIDENSTNIMCCSVEQ